jgi:hypothetical protein
MILHREVGMKNEPQNYIFDCPYKIYPRYNRIFYWIGKDWREWISISDCAQYHNHLVKLFNNELRHF